MPAHQSENPSKGKERSLKLYPGWLKYLLEPDVAEGRSLQEAAVVRSKGGQNLEAFRF